MNPEIALKLLQKYVHGETLLRHCKTVGVAIQDCILAMRTRHEEIGC